MSKNKKMSRAEEMTSKGLHIVSKAVLDERDLVLMLGMNKCTKFLYEYLRNVTCSTKKTRGYIL